MSRPSWEQEKQRLMEPDPIAVRKSGILNTQSKGYNYAQYDNSNSNSVSFADNSQSRSQNNFSRN